MKLNQVELIGNFPNASLEPLILPHLHGFRLILTNYPNFGGKELLERTLFFQKGPKEIDPVCITEIGINLKLEFAGFELFEINHQFRELIFRNKRI
jgi:hypothetical protein